MSDVAEYRLIGLCCDEGCAVGSKCGAVTLGPRKFKESGLLCTIMRDGMLPGVVVRGRLTDMDGEDGESSCSADFSVEEISRLDLCPSKYVEEVIRHRLKHLQGIQIHGNIIYVHTIVDSNCISRAVTPYCGTLLDLHSAMYLSLKPWALANIARVYLKVINPSAWVLVLGLRTVEVYDGEQYEHVNTMRRMSVADCADWLESDDSMEVFIAQSILNFLIECQMNIMPSDVSKLSNDDFEALLTEYPTLRHALNDIRTLREYHSVATQGARRGTRTADDAPDDLDL